MRDESLKKSAKKSASAPGAQAGADAAQNADSILKDELKQKLRYQIEFYFGDSNLAKDKFLRKKLERNDRNSPFNCVRIDEILKFN
jgi:hypothetical protein